MHLVYFRKQILNFTINELNDTSVNGVKKRRKQQIISLPTSSVSKTEKESQQSFIQPPELSSVITSNQVSSSNQSSPVKDGIKRPNILSRNNYNKTLFINANLSLTLDSLQVKTSTSGRSYS